MWSMAVRLGPAFQSLGRHFSLEIEERKIEKTLLSFCIISHSCISFLQQVVLSHWFLLISLRLHLSYLSITAFKLD